MPSMLAQQQTHALGGLDLAGIEMLREKHIRPGERWIYTAGFNVPGDLSDTSRVDVEVADIDRLARAGACVAILAHQGSFGAGTARALDDVAALLARRLERPVRYVQSAASEAAVQAAEEMRPGDVTLFGNTRLEPGEERDDPALAERFALLGDQVAVGGFCKAHRAHASNSALLRLRPGFAADSLLSEIEMLAPWAGSAPGVASLAVLGGRKLEKVTIGLCDLPHSYEAIVPLGCVLCTVLMALGIGVGCSDLGEHPERRLAAAKEALKGTVPSWLRLPSRTVIARPTPAGGFEEVHVVDPLGGVPASHSIVDAILDEHVLSGLRDGGSGRVRMILAGPPGISEHGFSTGAMSVTRQLAEPHTEGLSLGGDTSALLRFAGAKSTGGGSALQLIASGSLAVLDTLRCSTGARRS